MERMLDHRIGTQSISQIQGFYFFFFFLNHKQYCKGRLIDCLIDHSLNELRMRFRREYTQYVDQVWLISNRDTVTMDEESNTCHATGHFEFPSLYDLHYLFDG